VLPENDINSLAGYQAKDTLSAENSLNSLVGKSMESGTGITQDQLEAAKKTLYSQISELGLAEPYDSFSRGVVDRFLRPNTFVDNEKTKLKQEAAMDAVAPTMISVKEGEKLIGEGEIVTEEQFAKLQALGLTREKPPFTSILGIFLLVGLMTASVLIYLYQQNREIYEHAGHLYLLGMIVIVVMAVGKALIAMRVTQWPEFGAQFGFMVPVAAAGMLVTILLDSRLAVLVVAILSLLLGIMTGGQLQFALVGLVGGMTGIYSVSKLSQRSDLVRAAIYICGVNVIAIFIVGLVNSIPMTLLLSTSLALGIVNGILSSILTNGSLPFLENTFHITSAVRLLEISNPNNVLLKRLLTEAPGTYHHSIIVGNLAESATDALGGDSLMVRVGAYYHDIGKSRRPYFYIENQMTVDNPHDKIAPTLSALIITSHVKDGLELAKEHKLPQQIQDIIAQHHGDGLVSFFYHKALEENEDIPEDTFHYEGPKPQTKETALVALADNVEAAVRSMKQPTPGRVEGLIRKIIKDKLNDGQLDQCDLTFQDLDRIAIAFVRVLNGIFHSRVEYPELPPLLKNGSGGAQKKLVEDVNHQILEVSGVTVNKLENGNAAEGQIPEENGKPIVDEKSTRV